MLVPFCAPPGPQGQCEGAAVLECPCWPPPESWVFLPPSGWHPCHCFQGFQLRNCVRCAQPGAQGGVAAWGLGARIPLTLPLSSPARDPGAEVPPEGSRLLSCWPGSLFLLTWQGRGPRRGAENCLEPGGWQSSFRPRFWVPTKQLKSWLSQGFPTGAAARPSPHPLAVLFWPATHSAAPPPGEILSCPGETDSCPGLWRRGSQGRGS